MTVVGKISAFELQGPTMNPSSHVPVLYTVPLCLWFSVMNDFSGSDFLWIQTWFRNLFIWWFNIYLTFKI